jgi:5-formyltetrahydrofolate cyclo-ligase
MAAYRMGLCFPWQMVDAVPFEPHDVMMDEVIC